MDKLNFLEDEIEDLKKSLFQQSSPSGAIGKNATTVTGGAAGDYSHSTNGFAGGENASASASGAVQLGEDTNSETNSLKFRSFKLVDSNGKIPSERLNIDNVSTSATPNTTFVDTSAGGNVTYTKLGNIVFVHVNDITFKNTRQEHGNTLFSNLPKALNSCCFCMTCWGGTLTTLRVRIYTNETEMKNYWSGFTPSTAQKWSGSFVYLCK